MSLLSALSVSASGLTAQRTRAELLVENLANSETTRTPEGAGSTLIPPSRPPLVHRRDRLGGLIHEYEVAA